MTMGTGPCSAASGSASVNGTAWTFTCCGFPLESRLKLLPSRQSGACQVPLTIAATCPDVPGTTLVIV